MLHVAIVEDDPVYMGELKQYLAQYEKECGESISVTTFSDGDEIVEMYKTGWDIILMDIEMPFLDGMTAAEKIREIDSGVVIIFITNSPQYAIRGYTVGALDYILKPVSYYAFSQRMERARRHIGKKKAEHIVVNGLDGLHRMEKNDLFYVEIEGRMLVYHTKSGEIRSYGTMASAERELPESAFYRCNKGLLINLEHIEAIIGEEVQVAGVRLPVSRARRKGLLDALNDYMNEVGR